MCLKGRGSDLCDTYSVNVFLILVSVLKCIPISACAF